MLLGTKLRPCSSGCSAVARRCLSGRPRCYSSGTATAATAGRRRGGEKESDAPWTLCVKERESVCVCLAVCVCGGCGCVHRTSVARGGIGLRGNKHGRLNGSGLFVVWRKAAESFLYTGVGADRCHQWCPVLRSATGGRLRARRGPCASADTDLDWGVTEWVTDLSEQVSTVIHECRHWLTLRCE